ncbi:unnamed protein product [Ectocarpus sp. 12 AP-2014]
MPELSAMHQRHSTSTTMVPNRLHESHVPFRCFRDKCMSLYTLPAPSAPAPLAPSSSVTHSRKTGFKGVHTSCQQLQYSFPLDLALRTTAERAASPQRDNAKNLTQ